MNDCAFCKRKFNHERNRTIYEGKNVLVFLSNPRLTKGHLLVIPKRHVERPSEMTAEEKLEIFETVLKFQDKIIDKIGGCDIRENCRPELPENDLKVNHIHFHLIPRTVDDEIYQKYEYLQRDVFKRMTSQDIEESLALFGE